MDSASFPDFRRALALLNANWSMILPGLVIGALSGLLEGLFTPPDTATPAGSAIGLILILITDVVAAILAIAYTTGMAQAAWTRGHATFGDGAQAFRREGGHVFIAMLVLLVLGLAAAFLAPFTVGLSLAVYAFFCIYTMPAAVVGERKGFEAVSESAEIAYHRPLQTGILIVAIAIIGALMGYVAELLGFAPLIGPIVKALVVQAVIAYVTLVVVGEYVTLRGRPA